MLICKILLTSLIFLFQFDCGALKKSPTFPSEIPKDLTISLERTACYGTCPGYKLTIKSDGKVTFEGRDHTKVKDKTEGKITPENLKKLFSEFEKADFFNLKDSYRTEEDGCGAVSTDMPSEIIFIKFEGKNKTVSHYFGCEGVKGDELERISKLGKKIDEMTNSKQWIGERN